MKLKYLAMAMAALCVVSCGKKKDDAALMNELPQVKLTTVRSADIPQTETYSGTVESDVKNNITPNMSLRIEKILVEVGDNVSKGQCIVKLDQSSLEQLKLNIANQKAVIENYETDFNRIEQLYKVGGVSKAEYDNAKVNLQSQQTQHNILKSQLAQMSKNTALYAPISGVVTARNYDNGDMYTGTPILTIEQTNPVKLIVNVSEEHYKEVKVGQTVDVTLDAYAGDNFQGKVTIKHPNIDASTHTFPVEITISNQGQKVRPGMFARASINFGEKNHVLIPDEALVKQIGAGDRYVYVYNPKTQTVSYNKVELGQHIGSDYEIIEGVNSGDQVVIAGHARLANGKKVEVVK